jgi:hypothetical protein
MSEGVHSQNEVSAENVCLLNPAQLFGVRRPMRAVIGQGECGG